MKLGEIKAQVMYKWNRKRNRGCKFVPGDLVKVNYTYEHESKTIKECEGREGIILAVTSPDGRLIRSFGRAVTKYYVLFTDNMEPEVHGFYVGSLKKI